MNNSDKKTLVLIRITGLLGRNFLFESIKQNINSLSNIEIIILGRSSKEQNIKDRIYEILFNEGVDYLSIQKDKLAELNDFFYSNISLLNLI